MCKKLLRQLPGVGVLHKEDTQSPWPNHSRSVPQRMTVSHEAFKQHLSKDLKPGDTLKIHVRPPGSEVTGGVDRGPLDASYQVQQQPGADGDLVGILDVTKVRNYMNSSAAYCAEVLENDVVLVWPTEQQDYFVLGLVKETCYVCGKETGIASYGRAYFCDGCNKGVHGTCAGVKRKLRKDEDFFCPNCRTDTAKGAGKDDGGERTGTEEEADEGATGDDEEAEDDVESSKEEAEGHTGEAAEDVGMEAGGETEAVLGEETEKVGRKVEEKTEGGGEGKDEPSLGTDMASQGEEDDEDVAQPAVAEDEGEEDKVHYRGDEEEELEAEEEVEKQDLKEKRADEEKEEETEKEDKTDDKRKTRKHMGEKAANKFKEETVSHDKGDEKRESKKSGKRKAKDSQGKHVDKASPVAKATAVKELEDGGATKGDGSKTEHENASKATRKEGRKQKGKAKAEEGEDVAAAPVADGEEAVAKAEAKVSKQKGKEGKRKREEDGQKEGKDVEGGASNKDERTGESKDAPEVEAKRQKKDRNGGKDLVEEPKAKVESPSARVLRSRPGTPAEAQLKAKRTRKGDKADGK